MSLKKEYDAANTVHTQPIKLSLLSVLRPKRPHPSRVADVATSSSYPLIILAALPRCKSSSTLRLQRTPARIHEVRVRALRSVASWTGVEAEENVSVGVWPCVGPEGVYTPSLAPSFARVRQRFFSSYTLELGRTSTCTETASAQRSQATNREPATRPGGAHTSAWRPACT